MRLANFSAHFEPIDWEPCQARAGSPSSDNFSAHFEPIDWELREGLAAAARLLFQCSLRADRLGTPIVRAEQGRAFDLHDLFRRAERRWCARFSVYSLAWLRPLRNSDFARKPCQVATRPRKHPTRLNRCGNADTLRRDGTRCAGLAPSCESMPQRAISGRSDHIVAKPTELTADARPAAGRGIRHVFAGDS